MATIDIYEEWSLRGQSNLVRRQLDAAKQSVKAVLKRQSSGLIISGAAGIGKNVAVEEVFCNAKVRPEYGMPNSALGLIDLIYKAGDKTVVIDEACRSISAVTINIYKKALDPTPSYRWIVNNIKGKKNDEDDHLSGKPFLSRCGLILLMNKNPYDAAQWSPKLHQHLQALTSRVDVYNIPSDIATIWEYTCYLAVCKGLLRNKLKIQYANEALKYFTETVHKTSDASPRRLEQIARTMLIHPENWKEQLNMRLPASNQWISCDILRAPVMRIR